MKRRYNLTADTPDYHKGFLDGMKSAFEESELDAYYAGVGYGKKLSGTKHLGFTSDKERQQFEAGISNNSKHFRSYRSEPLTLFERIFGGEYSRRDTIHISDKHSSSRSKVKRAGYRKRSRKKKSSRRTSKKTRR